VLPLKNTVLFPYLLSPLLVSSPRSKQLIEEVLVSPQRMLVCVAVKSAVEGSPGANDVYRVGTLMRIAKMVKFPDDTYRLLVQGVARSEVAEFTSEEPFLRGRVRVLEETGDLEGAEAQFRIAIRRDPRNAPVRTNFGGLLYLMGRYEEARQELERATAIDPDYASAWNNLGAALGRLGRSAEEIAAYRKATDLDPAYADVRHNLGLALLKSGEAEAGEREMRKALDLDPAYVPAYLNLAQHLLAGQRESEALDLLRQGAQKAPPNADLLVLLGEACLRLGRTPEAMSAFEESLRINPDQVELRRRLEELRSGPASEPGAATSSGEVSR